MTMLRTALKTATAWAVTRTGFDSIARTRLHRDLPFVAGYHRVVERVGAPNGSSLPAMEISAPMFERHLDWLARHFRIVSLDELGAKLFGPAGAKPLAAITFDDGYSDVYHYAFPILKRKGIPAGMFVVTDLIGTTRLPIHEELYRALARWGYVDPFSATRSMLSRLPQAELKRIIDESPNGDDVCGELQPLSWGMIAEMRTAGITIGSHSKSHAFLTNETQERVTEEVEGSRAVLQEKLGEPIDWFAYPGGTFNHSVLRAVERAGYRFAFTDCRRRDTEFPLLTLPRKGLWERSCLDPFGRFSPSIMSCHTAAMFDRFRDCEHDH